MKAWLVGKFVVKSIPSFFFPVVYHPTDFSAFFTRWFLSWIVAIDKEHFFHLEKWKASVLIRALVINWRARVRFNRFEVTESVVRYESDVNRNGIRQCSVRKFWASFRALHGISHNCGARIIRLRWKPIIRYVMWNYLDTNAIRD